jgi:GNAT superfamily N-acetyltransferase
MAGPGWFRMRAAERSDRDAIVEFNARLAAETEAKTLDRGTLAQGVDAALADPERLRYWVAESVPGRLIGQAAVTREWSDWRNGWLWWFQSVYVAPEARGQGVFRALYRHIRDEARRAYDVVGLRLYVEHENGAAQATYQRLGMRPGGYHVFEELWGDRLTAPGGSGAPSDSAG